MTHTALGLVVLIVAAHAVLLAVAYGLMRLVVWAGRALPDHWDAEPPNHAAAGGSAYPRPDEVNEGANREVQGALHSPDRPFKSTTGGPQ